MKANTIVLNESENGRSCSLCPRDPVSEENERQTSATIDNAKPREMDSPVHSEPRDGHSWPCGKVARYKREEAR
jgi:hypothetical protein